MTHRSKFRVRLTLTGVAIVVILVLNWVAIANGAHADDSGNASPDASQSASQPASPPSLPPATGTSSQGNLERVSRSPANMHPSDAQQTDLSQFFNSSGFLKPEYAALNDDKSCDGDDEYDLAGNACPDDPNPHCEQGTTEANQESCDQD